MSNDHLKKDAQPETAAESGDPIGRVALAWLPAGDYEQAVTLWPNLVVSWPPGRNEQCWCGSGRKCKKCCAAGSFEVTPS
jgi:uncharacterized protein YecA (UPF0149 family)